MTRSALPKLRVYAVFAATALIAAVALGRPELVSLAAPFALFLTVGLLRLPETSLTVETSLDRERVVEGDELELATCCTPASRVDRLELQESLPPGLEAIAPSASSIALAAGEVRTIARRFRCARWGLYPVGATTVRAFDRFGLVVDEAQLEPAFRLRVYPSAERLQRLLQPVDLQPFAGDRVARTKADGIEFADVRPFAPGDRIRRINWRASARRQELFVNESHPERNADIVLFLDSFGEGGYLDARTLDRTVRAAAALTAAYLARRDRVGLVSFGGVVRWLAPASGVTQLHRIVEAVLQTQTALSYAWKDIDVLPRQTLPPQSLVLALSPLLDQRTLAALSDLRGRGFDLAIIDISPLVEAEPGGAAPGQLPLRVWKLWRETLRYRYERLGVPVVEWREGEPIAVSLEEVRSFRRQARRLPA